MQITFEGCCRGMESSCYWLRAERGGKVCVVNSSTAPWCRAPLPPLPGRCAAAHKGVKWGEDDGVAIECFCAASASQTES